MAQTAEERREYARGWRERNADKMRAYSLEYRKKNSISLRSKKKSYYSDNAKHIRSKSSSRYSIVKSSPKWLYQQYGGRAKSRGVSFELSFDQFVTFWQKPCFYGGEAIATIGLDRVDSSLGYSVGNVVPCCRGCNVAKLDGTSQEFIARCHRVARIHREAGHGV
jgi:hypothetical protein